MTNIIVAIGGKNHNESVKLEDYNSLNPKSIDKEIVRLAGKKSPNFLFLGHANPLEEQNKYEIIKTIYSKLGCTCNILKSNELTDKTKVNELITSSDIIYVGGGNTLNMIRLWKKHKFDEVLKKSWQSGKVMCGLSAGAGCWFKECTSDSLKILYGSEEPYVGVRCLGFMNYLFTPHSNEKERLIDAKNILKENNLIGISVSNEAAIEIVDDNITFIQNDDNKNSEEPFCLISYWKENKYFEKHLEKNKVISIDKLNE